VCTSSKQANISSNCLQYYVKRGSDKHNWRTVGRRSKGPISSNYFHWWFRLFCQTDSDDEHLKNSGYLTKYSSATSQHTSIMQANTSSTSSGYCLIGSDGSHRRGVDRKTCINTQQCNSSVRFGYTVKQSLGNGPPKYVNETLSFKETFNEGGKCIHFAVSN
jgi:hypothetical protein